MTREEALRDTRRWVLLCETCMEWLMLELQEAQDRLDRARRILAKQEAQ